MALDMARMFELAQAHETFEIGDLDRPNFDRTMATLVEHPIYLWFPHRLRIEGDEAVRAMYARLAPVIRQMAVGLADRKVHFAASGENQLAAEVEFDFRFPNGSIKKVRIAAFIQFVGEKMVGETQYTDRDLAAVLDELFDDAFLKLPGVSRF